MRAKLIMTVINEYNFCIHSISKGARVDYWMLSEFDCFNVEMGLHVLPDGFVMGVEDKALVFGRPFIKRMFVAAGQFQKLGLTERERNILKCIYIFSRGWYFCDFHGSIVYMDRIL